MRRRRNASVQPTCGCEKRHRSHTQTQNKNSTTHHTTRTTPHATTRRTPPSHLATLEGGAATVRTTCGCKEKGFVCLFCSYTLDGAKLEKQRRNRQ